ncbi:hypothetical protein [Streptomyces sp. NPDC048340]|uniref:hypothetical protein n=1 Tax=Streptomyces sp. NPDC048340 TaxID=3365537 RepID=UPI00371A65AB
MFFESDGASPVGYYGREGLADQVGTDWKGAADCPLAVPGSWIHQGADCGVGVLLRQLRAVPDVCGRRRTFTVGLAAFGLASLLSATAPGPAPPSPQLTTK